MYLKKQRKKTEYTNYVSRKHYVIVCKTLHKTCTKTRQHHSILYPYLPETAKQTHKGICAQGVFLLFRFI